MTPRDPKKKRQPARRRPAAKAARAPATKKPTRPRNPPASVPDDLPRPDLARPNPAIGGALIPRTARRLNRLRLGVLGLVVLALLAAVQFGAIQALFALYVLASLLLGAICATTLVWMLHAWRTPEALVEGRLRGDELPPNHSFSLIVPARHEEAVLEQTLTRLAASEHPDFEVLVVVGADDPATHEAAARVAARFPNLIKVLVDANWPKSKPKALNTALPYCTGDITGVFDAEDDVNPRLLRRIDHCFQDTEADVVQGGVQLMNFGTSWLTVRNVLEYYFWFRSRLHFQARAGFIPLGGNTVFIRTQVLQALSGWDEECLAEDCELGVRLSAFGARTVVVYEPELVTREECPPTLGAFTRQRTRWNQGFLQTLAKGYWRRLPPQQRALGVYTLAMPYLLALAWLLIPVAIATALAVRAPILISLVSFVPAVPMLCILAVEVAALADFGQIYGERASARDYLRLIVGLPLYQAVLAYAAARAVVREARGERGWEKTAHLGLHLSGGSGGARGTTAAAPAFMRLAARIRGASRSPGPPRKLTGPPPRRLAASERPPAKIPRKKVAAAMKARPRDRAVAVRAATADARGHLMRAGSAGLRSTPLWLRLPTVSANGAASLSITSVHPGALAPPRVGWPRDLRALVRRAVVSRADIAVMLGLLVAVGVGQGTNMLHWPAALFDEGTYIGNAWAVHHGALAPYTYGYGHPPLSWLLIFLWTQASGVMGSGGYSIDGGRELMLAVSLVSSALLYTLARRIALGRLAACAAVLLFALSPLALFFHRAVLLDNPAVAWALAAFVLALTPQRRLWAFAASGACFAASVLSKETTFVLFPALLMAAASNADPRTRRYCLSLFGSFLFMLGLVYPLYATLKGELLPGPHHVSLVGEMIVQLFTRKSTGSVFDPHSTTYATVVSWLNLDPWLLAGALVLAPLALRRRRTRAVTVAFLIQVAMVLRPGYLPGMYVIGLLPFAALIVAAGGEALWRWWRSMASGPSRRLLAVVVGSLALPLVLTVTVTWAHRVHEATTARPDAPRRAAERWLTGHIGHHERLIVDDEYWIYLIDHGFNDQPVRGGFFSRTVVSFWPLDYDPAVQRLFPDGWRDFDYIVSTQSIRDTGAQTPQAVLAIDHSRVVASFGHGVQRIEIRAITHPPRNG